MTYKDKVINLLDEDIPVLRYGDGVICHQTLARKGIPYLIILGLNRDCRHSEIKADDVVCVLGAIPFNDKNTIDAFKYSISQIEELFAQNENKTGE